MADSPDTTTPSRRYALGLLAGATALATAPLMAGNANAEGALDDAELIALDAEIRRLYEAAVSIELYEVKPLNHLVAAELCRTSKILDAEERKAVFLKFEEDIGRAAAMEDALELFDRSELLYDRMRAIPAKTQAGRAAKVRALIVSVMGSEWRGPDLDDWANEQARSLLAEFAGITPEELAAI